MELIRNITTGAYFEVPETDFDKFQDIFAVNDTNSQEDAIEDVLFRDEIEFTREYTEDEVKSIFDEHAELSGMDVEIFKNKIIPSSYRSVAKNELLEYINTGKPISIDSANALLKVIDTFNGQEFSNKY